MAVVTPYGLREIKLVRGTSVVQLPIAQTAEVNFTFSTGDLKGDDILVRHLAILESAKITLKNGGLTLEALALFFATSTTPGSGYNKLTLLGGEICQPLALYARALGPNGDDIHVKLYQVVLDDTKFNLAQSTFSANDNTLTAFRDPIGGRLIDIVWNQVGTALPVIASPYSPF